ncbi:Alpha crystallin/Hsp20 domain-containing protein [Artemisia annua]|uniref:Alpha crystallin/Hsp20 domain-containing protein n=1 Tax=Artemisia annua TaxID=35608 RepID=A0A2U1L087_ARTAN|nr:Alpha crystallin/Hsp20 domain-containing protein [Artemisia annua]
MDSKVGSTNLQTLLSYDEFEPMCTWQREDAQDVLILHLPDFKKEQLRIQISNTGLLKITGEYNVEGKRKGRFQKEVKVTKEYDSNNIHAKFSQGRLRITLPKKVVTPPVPASPPPMVTSSPPDDQSNNMNTTGQSVAPSVKAKVGQVLRSKEFTQIMVNLGFAVVLAFSVYSAYKYWTTYIQVVDED